MSKLSIKKLVATVVVVGAAGASTIPMSASALNYHNNSNNYSMMNVNRSVTRNQARNIAQDIFPNRTIQSVMRHNDDGVWEFQVRFTDGTRVDVRQSNGRVTYVHSSHSVNANQAQRIAEAVFPRKDVRNVVLRTNGVDLYRVRFTDGSHVDVRVSNGMILNVVNSNNV